MYKVPRNEGSARFEGFVGVQKGLIRVQTGSLSVIGFIDYIIIFRRLISFENHKDQPPANRIISGATYHEIF